MVALWIVTGLTRGIALPLAGVAGGLCLAAPPAQDPHGLLVRRRDGADRRAVRHSQSRVSGSLVARGQRLAGARSIHGERAEVDINIDLSRNIGASMELRLLAGRLPALYGAARAHFPLAFAARRHGEDLDRFEPGGARLEGCLRQKRRAGLGERAELEDGERPPRQCWARSWAGFGPEGRRSRRSRTRCDGCGRRSFLLVVVPAVARLRATLRQPLLPALIVIWFFFQASSLLAVNEGRYRKPLEGLLVAQVLALLDSSRAWPLGDFGGRGAAP